MNIDGGGIRCRSREPKPEASPSCLVFLLKGQRPIMAHAGRFWWLWRLVCAAVVWRVCLIKALAARRPTWSSRRRALMAGADGQTRHQCLAENALDEAEVAAQTGQYRGGEDGSCCVAAMWARRGHKKVRTDRSPVRANPLPHLD
jgi:hypothetical protein